MGIQGQFLLALLVLVNYAVTNTLAFPRIYRSAVINPKEEPLSPIRGTQLFGRMAFDDEFVFGAASSAYQVEGAANEGGRGPSVWDTFTNKSSEKIKDRSNGKVAADSYHRYKEDVSIMKEMGVDGYRFSISWSRVLPRGKLNGGVNEEGIKYYNNLIDELQSKGIKPFVTLFHWDLPQALEDEYGGFLSTNIMIFVTMPSFVSKRFGDRVKFWITLNEPWSYSNNGYATGEHAPDRCSFWMQKNCTGGDSGTEPYIVTHHQLLAHAAAVKLYKEKYQANQNGKIGINLASTWMAPFSNKSLDRRASIRALDFMLGWCMDPLIYGDYPHSMRNLVRDRLPEFTKEQSEMVKGSFDFIGLNYYTAFYAAHKPNSNSTNVSYTTDSLVNLTTDRNGVLNGGQAAPEWLNVYSKGLLHLLHYVQKKYNNPPVYVTENGIDEVNNDTISVKEALVDNFRIKNGANVKGFFAWSILDGFEWNAGYTIRFGITYVDYKDGLKRYPKLSAEWFKNFLKK